MDFIIIGKYSSDSVNGPASVVKELDRQFKTRKDINYISVIMNETISKTSYLKKIFCELKKSKNAVVNVHSDGVLISLYVYFLSKVFTKHRYYLTQHGLYAEEKKYNKKNDIKIRILEKFLLNNFQNIICVSEKLKEDVFKNYNRKKNVFVIPNGVIADSIYVKKEKNYKNKIKIITLGGLKEGKGIEETLNLFLSLKEKGLNIELNIWGAEQGIHTKEWLNKWFDSNNIIFGINYCGVQYDKQLLYDEIAKSHFQLCLSQYDTFNIAIAESLTLGCPCIASKQCGASYLIDTNKAGIVVDINDDNKFEIIYQYVSDFINGNILLEKDNDSIDYYKKLLSWENITDEYIKLL